MYFPSKLTKKLGTITLSMSHAFSFLLCKFPHKLPKKLGTMMLCKTNGTLLYYGKVRFAFNIQLNAARTENAVAKTLCLIWNNQKTQSPKNECKTISRETEHGTITKHNLQRMNTRPYPQKKDVDSIALNTSLHPLQNRNFTSIFDVQRQFRAKRLQWTPQSQFYLSF